MADQAQILKEFLVSLGFQVEPGSERRFIDSIGAATVKVVALGTAVTATAASVVAGVSKIADNLEQLYFASQRTGASVENIQSMSLAVRQLGGDSGAAQHAIENLARLMRNSPGGEGLLKNIGIQTRDANGQLRDTADMLVDLGAKFKDMPYYKANAFAQALGIDEKTLMALRSGVGQFSQQYKDMLRSANLDAQGAAKSSHEFMVQLRLLGSSMTILIQKIVSSLTARPTDAMRHLRENFVANFGRIVTVVRTVLDFVLRVADAIGQLAMRGAQMIGWLVDWFNRIPPSGQKIIEILAGILVAWRLLSAGFLATPLGRMVALGAAILALWDDYKTWKEGGKSLIDWSAWAPAIEAAIKGVKSIGMWIHNALGFTGEWRGALELLLAYVSGKWAFGMLGAIGKVAAAQGGLAGGFGLVRAGAVGAAAVGGYAVGTAIYKKLGDSVKDAIGGTIATILAAGGSGEAKQALENDMRSKASAAQVRRTAPVKSEPKKKSNSHEARGIRNNNPGNIKYGSFAMEHGAIGREYGEGKFARFPDAQSGLDALAALISSYMKRRIDSVYTIISRYAPKKENNTEAYVSSVAKRLGVNPRARLDPENMQQIVGMIDAIVRVENGKNPYSREMLEHAVGKGSIGAPQVSQTTTINVHGASDPKSVAHDVVYAQNDVNQNLFRNMRGAVVQ